jgi:pyruvate dehydrogenase E1 component alpha subunit
MSINSVAKKGDAYGIANEFVDGMDVMAVRDATKRAVDRARQESAPTLLEIRAYRFMGHSMSDPGNYRTRDEIAKYQERDPIVLFKDSLKEANVMSEKDFEKIEKEVTTAVQNAVTFAEESPLPDPGELMTNVFA